jgi:chemotaxis response regulator CheB
VHESQDYVTPPFLVAAVGASAGGLEAFSSLLRDMPGDAPLAVVLVQHLSRTSESLLAEILAARTALSDSQRPTACASNPVMCTSLRPIPHDGH